MNLVTKQFSPVLYENYDKKGKETAIKFIEDTLGMEITDFAEKFKAGDISARIENKNYIFEVEVKNNWGSIGSWNPNFDRIHIPARKRDTNFSWYIMLNKYLNTLVLINGDAVKKSPVIWKDTNNLMSGEKTINEFFFSIPYYSGIYYELSKNDKWQIVKPF